MKSFPWTLPDPPLSAIEKEQHGLAQRPLSARQRLHEHAMKVSPSYRRVTLATLPLTIFLGSMTAGLVVNRVFEIQSDENLKQAASYFACVLLFAPFTFGLLRWWRNRQLKSLGLTQPNSASPLAASPSPQTPGDEGQ